MVIMRICTVTLSVILFVSCLHESRLEQALRQSGDNRPELEKVLEHYRGDSLKYRAACFLIENMIGKYSVLPSGAGDKYRQVLSSLPGEDPVSWESGKSVVWHVLDSVSKRTGQDVREVKDLETVSSDFLISNIDRAFGVWESSPFTRYYSLDDFFHYVLPYRISNEPLSDWRSMAWQRYGQLVDSVSSPLELACRIMSDGSVRYNIGMEKYPYPLTYEETVSVRWGTCETMASFVVMSLRAVGIPVSIDYVPAWANRNAAHCWNVVKDESGNFVDIGFGEEGRNEIIYKVSKIYRRQYASGYNLDVTSEYDMPLSSLSFSCPDVREVVALCTFNNRAWTPVAFSEAKEGQVTFHSVGRGILWGENKIRPYEDEGKGIVYLATSVEGGNRKPLADPVIVYEKGDVRSLRTDTTRLESIVLHRKYPLYGVRKPGKYNSNDICPGDVYELYYWDNKWRSLGRQIAVGRSLEFDNVPSGSLLWLHDWSGGREERIFTYENGKQIWW